MVNMAKTRRTPVNFSEADGFRYLHFGSEWIQGGMRISRPFNLSLEYQQFMMAILLFESNPTDILQLGLGAGGLAKFTRKYFPQAKTKVVEISEDVYMAARMWFRLPLDDQSLEVVFSDCKQYLHQAKDSADWLLVDIYDATAWGPVYDDVGFYRLCRNSLRDGGVSSYNVFGGEDFTQSLGNISQAFDGKVLVMPEVAEGNRIILARKGRSKCYEVEDLKKRAAEIQKQYKIPTKRWVSMLQEENHMPDEIIF